MINTYSRRSLMELTHEQLLLLIGTFAAFLTAASPILTTIGAAIGSWITARQAAKKSELERLTARLDRLRDDFDELQMENTQLHKENLRLLEYIAHLRVVLREHNINVPDFEEWSKSNGD